MPDEPPVEPHRDRWSGTEIEWAKRQLAKIGVIVAAIDDLKAENAEIKAAVVTLGEEIAQQIQQLVDAQGDEATQAAVVADLQATRTKLQELTTSLQADDPAPTPPPTP